MDDEAIQNLVDKMKAIRRSCVGRTDIDIRDTLLLAVQQELGELNESEAESTLDRVRGLLVEEARHREERIERLEADLRLAREEDRESARQASAVALKSEGIVHDPQ